VSANTASSALLLRSFGSFGCSGFARAYDDIAYSFRDTVDSFADLDPNPIQETRRSNSRKPLTFLMSDRRQMPWNSLDTLEKVRWFFAIFNVCVLYFGGVGAIWVFWVNDATTRPQLPLYSSILLLVFAFISALASAISLVRNKLPSARVDPRNRSLLSHDHREADIELQTVSSPDFDHS
jgi:hypothetical protein